MNALKRLMCVLGYSMMIHYIFTAESDNEKILKNLSTFKSVVPIFQLTVVNG